MYMAYNNVHALNRVITWKLARGSPKATLSLRYCDVASMLCHAPPRLHDADSKAESSYECLVITL